MGNGILALFVVILMCIAWLCGYIVGFLKGEIHQIKINREKWLELFEVMVMKKAKTYPSSKVIGLRNKNFGSGLKAEDWDD